MIHHHPSSLLLKSQTLTGGATVTFYTLENNLQVEEMVMKQSEIVEITPDPWETTIKTKKRSKTKTKKRSKTTTLSDEEDGGTPIRGIFCLKSRQDTKIFDDKEDCFILDFDPNDPFDATKISSSDNPKDDDGDDNEISILHEKGQVACRDYPHPRHLCSKFPFLTTLHATHCNLCYCYVCDLVAPCAHWKSLSSPHCEALDNNKWKPLRAVYRNRPPLRETTNK